MLAKNYDVAGYSEYPTMQGIGLVEPDAPTPGYPVEGDPRQLAVNSPEQIRVDAANFRLLDLPAPDTGNAYDPAFRDVVGAFQTGEGLTVDKLMGPITRQRLVLRVSELPGVMPVPPPPGAPVPTSPIFTPTSTQTTAPMTTGKKVAIGAGVLGALGLAWYALEK